MFGSNKKTKQQNKNYVDQNPVEAVTRIGSGVAQSLGADLLRGGANDLWKQMLGEIPQTPKSREKEGELIEGEEIDLSSTSKNQEHFANPDIAPGIDYRREILRGSERLNAVQTQSIEKQIEMILVELKQLATTSKELEIEFKDVVVEQRIVKPGKYHQSFLEWMVIIIRSARMRVENAGAWISVMHGKKSKKQQQGYWKMFEKHGTTFGLSNERVVATQTG